MLKCAIGEDWIPEGMPKSFIVSYLECPREILTFLFSGKDADDALAASSEKCAIEFAGK